MKIGDRVVVISGMYLGMAGKITGKKPFMEWQVRLDNGDVVNIPEDHLEKV